MKMAIIGSGPLAILTASHFDKMGAEVVLFQRSPLGGNIRFLMDHYPDLKINFQQKELSLNEFFEQVLVPTVMELEEFKLTKQGDVLRIHKRFIHPGEKIPRRTRLHDLFRVVYSLNPQETILKQFEENPEFFKQLGDEVIKSLHKPVESFEDFDIVIEATGLGKPPAPMGAGRSFALNESNLQESSVLYYEKEIFTKLDLENKKTLILVGEGVSLKIALLKLREWLFAKPGRELHWVTSLKANTLSGNPWIDTEVVKLMDEISQRFESAKITFETKMHEWRDLEDYIKVKVPKPIEPTPKLVVHEGYDVTSVDRLLDREGVFATIESPEFRDFVKKPGDMMTLAADGICVLRGVSDYNLGSHSLEVNEPGHYVLKSSNLNSALEEIKQIEQDILNYFKKA
jgi:hypothetical protein